jgi:hypothetical protein
MRMYPGCIGSPRSNEGNRRASLTVNELRTRIAATALLPVEQTHRPSKWICPARAGGRVRCLAGYPARLGGQ